VRGLRTWWGSLDLRVESAGTAVRVTVAGVDPPGGIVLHAPFGARPRETLVDGVAVRGLDAEGTVRLRAPATVEFRY